MASIAANRQASGASAKAGPAAPRQPTAAVHTPVVISDGSLMHGACPPATAAAWSTVAGTRLGRGDVDGRVRDDEGHRRLANPARGIDLHELDADRARDRCRGVLHLGLEVLRRARSGNAWACRSEVSRRM